MATPPRILLATLSLVAAVAGQRLVVQQGHRGGITGAAFSPDGELVVVGDATGNAFLWQVDSGRLLAALEPNQGRITGLAWSPDGRRVVGGSVNGRAQVWDTGTGRLLVSKKPFRQGGYCGVAVSADSRWFACGCDTECGVLAMDSGELRRRFDGPQQDRFWAMAISPDGAHLAAGGGESAVYVFHIDKGRRVRTLEHPVSEVATVAFHPDGRHLITCGREDRVRVWDWQAGKMVHELGDQGAVSFALSADGTAVAVGYADGRAAVMTFAGEVERELRAHGDWVRTLAFSPDGKILLTGADDATVHLWDVALGNRLRSFAGARASPQAVAATAEGRVQLAVIDGERLRILDLLAGTETWGRDGVGARVRVTFSPDGSHLAMADRGEKVRVWSAADGSPGPEFAAGPVASGAFALGNGGTALACRITAGDIGVYRSDPQTRVTMLPGNQYTDILSLAFDASGHRLAQGGKGNFLAVYDVQSGEQTGTHYGPAGWVYALGFSGDGEHLLAGGPYASLTLRGVDPKLTVVRTMEGHRGGIHSVAFAAGDQRLLSVGGEGTVGVWDTGSGAQLGTLHPLPGGAWVLVAPDGRYDFAGDARAHCAWVVESSAGLTQESLADQHPRRRPGLLAELLDPR